MLHRSLQATFEAPNLNIDTPYNMNKDKLMRSTGVNNGQHVSRPLIDRLPLTNSTIKTTNILIYTILIL